MNEQQETQSKQARARGEGFVRVQQVARPLAKTAIRRRDWQVVSILPDGWIETDCNSGKERFVPRVERSQTEGAP